MATIFSKGFAVIK